MKFKIFLIFLVLSLIPLSNPWILHVRHREDAKGAKFYALDFIGLVEELGGQAEWYNVTTADGYILSLFRVPPYAFSTKKLQGGPPVYLQHGLFGSADVFMARRPEKNIVKTLSDAGYDVWIGNLRGNTYSRKHLTILPDDPQFWDFTLDDHAFKDLPAVLDYILTTTNQTTLTYMGVSLGTTINMALLSDRTEYNDKINLVVHFSPVAFFKTKTLTRLILAFVSEFLEPMFMNYSLEIGDQSAIYYGIIEYLCLPNDFTKELCLTVGEIFFGKNREQLDMTWDSILTSSLYTPAGSSSKILLHYGQRYRTGRFQYFDYKNDTMNLQHYGQVTPPEYNVSNIASPMVYYHPGQDQFATPEDSLEFISRLNKKLMFIYRPFKTWSHVNFIGARDIKIVFDDLLKILPRFTKF